MIKKLLNLRALFMLVIMLCSLGAWAADEVCETLTFPASTQEKVSAYSSEWTATTSNGTWTITNFNNNNNGWAYIKCGWKTAATTSTITSYAINEVVTKIAYTFDKVASVTSASFIIKNGDNVVSTTDITTDLAAGDVVVPVSDAVAGYTYTLSLENAKTSTNGTTQISKVTVYKEKVIEAGQTETTTTFPETAYTAYIGEDFTSPVATVSGGEGLAPTYSSDNEDVATVNATTGVVTLVKAGTAKITASFAETDAYTSSSTTYTLTVGNAYADIKALQTGTTATELPMKLTLSNATVTGVSGNNAYISDGTYGATIYTSGHGLTAGQTITGTLEATCLLYYGAAEIKNYTSTGLTITDGTLGDAPVVAIANLTKENHGKYCKLENVAYASSAATFSDGTNTIAYYDGLKTSPAITDGKNYDVVGIVSYRKTSTAETLQFFPISVEEKTVAVEAPVISLVNGTYKGTQSVTITDATEGAEIYYTLDESDPTTSGTAVKYTEAISITATTTIIAAAKSGDTWSNPVSRTYTIVPLYQNIETAKAAMTATTAADAVDCYITLTDAVVTYINGSNYYVEDGTAGMLIYNNSTGVSEKLTKAGLILNGDLKCAGYIYNGLHEYTKNFDFTDVTITEGTEIPCTELTLAELLEEGAMETYESMRVKIVDANVSSALSSRKATIAQGDNSIQVYEKKSGNLAGTALASKEWNATIIGYPGINNSTNQLNVWEATDVTATYYTRTVTEGSYGTICLPYSVDTDDILGGTFYAITGIDTNGQTLTITEQASLEAGKPYIFLAEDDAIVLGLGSTSVTEPASDTYLAGTFTAITAEAGWYVMQKQNGVIGFYEVGTTTPTIGANRAYMKAQTSGIKGFTFDKTDAVEAIEALTKGDAKIYDTNGRQLQKMQKGINIVNGYKVIVK